MRSIQALVIVLSGCAPAEGGLFSAWADDVWVEIDFTPPGGDVGLLVTRVQSGATEAIASVACDTQGLFGCDTTRSFETGATGVSSTGGDPFAALADSLGSSWPDTVAVELVPIPDADAWYDWGWDAISPSAIPEEARGCWRMVDGVPQEEADGVYDPVRSCFITFQLFWNGEAGGWDLELAAPRLGIASTVEMTLTR